MMSLAEGLKATTRGSREDKAEVTTREANRIIAAETQARVDKTARLRELRLSQEAAVAPVDEKPQKKPARRAAKAK